MKPIKLKKARLTYYEPEQRNLGDTVVLVYPARVRDGDRVVILGFETEKALDDAILECLKK